MDVRKTVKMMIPTFLSKINISLFSKVSLKCFQNGIPIESFLTISIEDKLMFLNKGFGLGEYFSDDNI